MPGWKCDIRGISNWEDLPKQAKDYVTTIEGLIDVPIKIVSTGPSRLETIFR